jgi:DNA polymerase elongation subunit (family B)
MKQARDAGDEAAVKRWDAMQFATKSMVASLYGVCGDSKYGMYHPDIASSITYTSRQTLFRLRDECNDRGYPVVYGHTDSIFCEVPSPEEGEVLLAAINESMAPIEVEFEKWCSTMVLKAKNRYAGKVTWADGVHLDTADYYFKGLELKQARMPKAMKAAMQNVMQGILDGRPQDEVDEELVGLIERGKSGELGADLLPVGKLKQKLSSYKVLSGASAGAKWAKDHLGVEYQAGDFFLTAIDHRGRYIAFDRIEDLEGKAEVDWAEMTERYITKKACDVYDLVSWDTTPLLNAQRGVGRVAWL